jgi:hypothetical protein
MQTMTRYTLTDFHNVTFNGFEIKLPEETLGIISEIAQQVGSPTYIKTPIFSKKDSLPSSSSMKYGSTGFTGGDNVYKRKKRNKNVESVNDEDWESLRSFHVTKMEQKTGIDSKIDLLRTCLNKLTDKNYNEQIEKIIEIFEELVQNETNEEDMMKVGNSIFEIASNNRFFSKMYADLYALLIQKFELMKVIFENSFNTFLELFKTIEYVESEEDYDRFCKINKDNEKRKALSLFFVNLSTNKIISKEQIIIITCDLMKQVVNLIKENNKKNEVDEITENIAILYSKQVFDSSTALIDQSIYEEKLVDVIHRLSLCKVKTFPSLSNKSIFKYMDMIDI